MSEAAAKVLEAARGLSPEDQRWVAEELWNQSDDESVSDEEAAEAGDDPALLALVEERIADRAVNPQDELPAADAVAAIRAELDRRQTCRSR